MTRTDRLPAAGGAGEADAWKSSSSCAVSRSPEGGCSRARRSSARATGRARPGGSRTSTTTPRTSACGRAASAFRVRKDGRRYNQTLKSNDAGGLVAYRGEWQTPLASSEPDLALMPAGAAEVLNGLVALGRAECGVRDARAAPEPRPPDDRSDGGQAGRGRARSRHDRGNGSSLPIAELELELLEGSPEALYALALELDALARCTLETRSKSARGYALAAGAAPAGTRRSRSRSRARTTVDDAIQAILRACLEHWCANEAAALDGSDPEGVHQMRVAIRRLRSAFSVFGRLIDAGAARLAERRGEAIVSGLGPARDWDVFLDELLAPVSGGAARRRASPRSAGRPKRHGPRATHRRARRSRRRPTPATCSSSGAGSRRAAGARRRRRGAPPGWSGRSPSSRRTCSASGSARRLRLGRDFAELSAEERHRLRIALKKLRYATEFFQTLYPEEAQAVSRGAEGPAGPPRPSQRRRGRRAADRRPHRRGRRGADGDGFPMGSGMVLGWLARGVAELEPPTLRAWQDFAEREPFWR